MRLDISSNLREVEKELNRLQRKQIPFAAAGAINATLFDVRKKVMESIDSKIDRPTPFTRKGVQVSKAKKRDLSGAVFIEGKRLPYMSLIVHGGESTRINEPMNTRLNQFGNIPRGVIKKAAANPARYFFGIPKGKQGEDKRGIWERTNKGHKIRQVTAFKRTRKAEKILPFYEVAEREARAMFGPNFEKKLAQALSTAKA